MQLGGIGGIAPSVIVTTQINFPQTDATPVVFRGQFHAFTELTALDMSVVGRDILDRFAVIVDRPGERIYLLRDRHRYTIQQV